MLKNTIENRMKARQIYIDSYIKKGGTVTEYPAEECTVIIYEDPKPCALVYDGSSAKPTWHYVFRNGEHREQKIAEHLTNRRTSIAYKAEREATRQDFRHTLKVGDILVSSWGYDQTNIDYYQVVAVKEKSVDIQPIKQNREYDKRFNDRGRCIPAKDSFMGEVMKNKRVRAGNYITLTSYSSAYPWDGRPEYWSNYA